jgi:hypothetical protein
MPLKTKHEREQEGKLQEQLTVQMKKQMSSSSSAAAAQIAKLQDQDATCTRKIEMERRRSEELDKHIAAMEENVRAQRKRMGGVNASQENHMQIAKQIKILENRLEKVGRRAASVRQPARRLPMNIDVFDGGDYRHCKSSMRRWHTTPACGKRSTTPDASVLCSTRSTSSWCVSVALPGAASCWLFSSFLRVLLLLYVHTTQGWLAGQLMRFAARGWIHVPGARAVGQAHRDGRHY